MYVESEISISKNVFWIVTEYLPGTSLESLLLQRPLSELDVIKVKPCWQSVFDNFAVD